MSLFRRSSVCRKFKLVFPNFEIDDYYEYENNERYYTKDFSIFLNEISSKWRFVVQFKNDHIGLFLEKIETSSNDFHIIFKVDHSIVDPDNRSIQLKMRRTADEISNKVGWKRIIHVFTLDDILKEEETIRFLYHDYFYFNIKITLCENKMLGNKTVEISDKIDDLSMYKKLHNSDELSDFVFICSDGMEIPAHREILVVGSLVMQAMLNAPMSESNAQTVNVDDIDGETMIEVLRFMYQEQVENVDKLATNLLYAAEKYDMEGLKTFCASSIAENLSSSNVIEYLLVAEQYNAKNLLMACINYIKCNYNAVRYHDDWKKLNFNILAALTDIIEEDSQQMTTFKTNLSEKPIQKKIRLSKKI